MRFSFVMENHKDGFRCSDEILGRNVQRKNKVDDTFALQLSVARKFAMPPALLVA